MKAPLLSVQSLSITLANQAEPKPLVEGVCFTIERGKTLALVGESGSGKSMTAMGIIRLLPPGINLDPSSEIVLDGKNLQSYSELDMRRVRGHRMAMIFQEALTALNPVLTIDEQIDEILRCHFRLSSAKRKQKILSLLDEVGIADPKYTAQCYPFQLSGGMQQRAMIAMALAGEPELLIADEPTTALDVTLQAQILTLLKKLQRTREMSILFITHDLGIVSEIADEVAVMYQGKIIESGLTKNILKEPQHAFSKKLLSSVPDLKAKQPQKTSEAIFTVRDLKVHFPIQKGLFKRVVGYIKAVDGIELTLYKGQTLALVGESGSGKTTAAKAMLQLEQPTAGSIQYHGLELEKLNVTEMLNIRQDLQMVFQNPYAALNPRMSVGASIAEGLSHLSRNEQKEKTAELLTLVGLLPEHAERYPHAFSGGQRQRICIARSLAPNPQLLICDEPTSALDVSVQEQILELLLRLQKELQLTILLITHNLGIVAYLAHSVAVMYQGKIIEQGDTKQILTMPQHPYTQALIAAVPKISETKVE